MLEDQTNSCSYFFKFLFLFCHPRLLFYNNDPGDNGGFIFFDVKTRNLVFVDGNAKIKYQHRLMRNSVNISSPRNFSSNNKINFRKKFMNRLAYNEKITDTNRDTSSRNSFTKLKGDDDKSTFEKQLGSIFKESSYYHPPLKMTMNKMFQPWF